MLNKKVNKTREHIGVLLYIIVLILVIIVNNYIGIYITMLPLLFILGMVGKCFFDRPVITSLFSFSVSICILYLKYNPGIIENILISACTALQVAFGELFYDFLIKIKKIIDDKKQDKNKIKKKNRIYTYIGTGVILVTFLIINNFLNGNIIEYEQCKKTLYKYIRNAYENSSDFVIVNSRYNSYMSRKYIFNVKNISDESINKFTIFVKNKELVKDEYKEATLEQNNNNLKNEINKYMIENNIKHKKELNVNLKYIDKDKIKLSITKDIDDITEEEKIFFSKDVINILNSFEKFDRYSNLDEIELFLRTEKDSYITSFSMDGYLKNIKNLKLTKEEYVLEALNIEYIDSKN